MAAEEDNLVAAVSERLRAGRIGMRAGETPDWDREAALLVAAATDEGPGRKLDDLVAHRLKGVPLGYLIGYEPFLGDHFQVEPGVIIPHPATELLAMLASQAVYGYAAAGESPELLEVGVGVGVIAVSVLKRHPAARAYASELSGAALRLTEVNAGRILGGTDRLSLYQAYFTTEAFSPFQVDSPKNVNVVVSNPPYLIQGDKISAATKKSGLAHLSYSPDNDPSWFLRQVVSAPDGLLAPRCSVLMECADWYLEDHDAVLREAGWDVEIFDRSKYVATFGRSPEMRDLKPTAHRVLYGWRGGGEGLSGIRANAQ